MLLGLSPNRRLMKEEMQSPAMAHAAVTVPASHGRPMRTAAQTKRTIAAARPRQVFERPSKGWPSHNTIPPSIGCANRVPSRRAKGPVPHWLRRREQGFEGSLGAGRTFTLRMVSVSMTLSCMSSRLCPHIAKIPPVTGLRSASRRTSCTGGEACGHKADGQRRRRGGERDCPKAAQRMWRSRLGRRSSACWRGSLAGRTCSSWLGRLVGPALGLFRPFEITPSSVND